MKAIKVIVAALAATALVASCNAQSIGADVDPATVKNVEDLLPSAAEIDSVSYLIGVNFGYFIKSNNFGENINYAQLRKGMADYIGAKGDERDSTFTSQFKIDPSNMNEMFNNFLTKRNNYKSELNRREGEDFLAKNLKKDGVVETESGLQYKILEPGNDNHPGPKDTVLVSYRGTLLNGEEFDASPEGQPVQMQLNRVIPGWTEGLQVIGEGGKAVLYIPANLAYGPRGNRSIEPNSTLIFDVELAEVRHVAVAE